MPKLISTKTYEKKLQKFRKQHPELKDLYLSTLQSLEENPFSPTLKLHKLHGSLSEFYAVSINYQYRIMLDFVIKDDQIILISIGTHDQLYR